MRRRRAFTLVELMIVVAIIGVLSAIAIPNLREMQYRAKRAEIPPNLRGIRSTLVAYEAAYDVWLEVDSFTPSSDVGKDQKNWVSGTNFDVLGWQPDGQVRGAYMLTTISLSDFVVTGICDIDGDGARATFTVTRDMNVALVTNSQIY